MQGQDTSLFRRELLIVGKDTMPYRILLPVDYSPKKRYPIVFFLHGSGERGRDNAAQLVHGSRLFLADSNRTKFRAIVVFPQCPPESYWSNVSIRKDSLGNYIGLDFPEYAPPTRAMTMLMELVRNMLRHYAVNENNYKFYVSHPASAAYAGDKSWDSQNVFNEVNKLIEKIHNTKITW
jgi:predicted peptidase